MWKEVSERMNHEKYIEMLKSVFPLMNLRKRMFQQDGASIHRAPNVGQFLNKNCPAGWIGLGSEKQVWPPYSPDIAPCDYGLWPYVLPKVQRRGATTREELRRFINEEFKNIPKQIIINICEGMVRRCNILIKNKGGNVEYPHVVE